MNKEPIEKILNINPFKLHAYSTGLLQGKAYNRLQTYLSRTLLPFNVSIPEWKLLGQLHEHKDIKLSKLAQLLSYDPPMVTKLVKLLERKKMVQRIPDRTDERAKIITITPLGDNLIKNAEKPVKKMMSEILIGVSFKDALTYLKVLTVIVNNTEE